MGLTVLELEPFMKLLTRDGYVLDFTDRSFGQFTMDVVGVNLKDKYGLSKAKSLAAYLGEAPRADCVTLLTALLNQWELEKEDLASPEQLKLADRCRSTLKVWRTEHPYLPDIKHLKVAGFTSAYLEMQVRCLPELVKVDPTGAIGTAKELCEACCKTILEQRQPDLAKQKFNMHGLVKATLKALGVYAGSVSRDTPKAQTIKELFDGLSKIPTALSELRNDYGTGHGKTTSFVPLDSRYAALAVGAALTIIRFLWDTHQSLLQEEVRSEPPVSDPS